MEEELLGETEVRQTKISKTFHYVFSSGFIMFTHKKKLSLCRQIMALGFDDKFIRTWEYYFDYCAAGFKTLTLGNYQVKTLT